VRWRLELLLLCGLVAGWHFAGATALGIGVAALAGIVALVPAARRAAIGIVQALVVPHRVRSGLVQAGVADRAGRLPWLVWARARGDAVLVEVWLRAGTTSGDLRAAAPTVASATGAAAVRVLHRSPRHDRAVVVVHRPRWGWLGK